MNTNDEYQEHIALIFSIIFPGAGFFYKKMWFTGLLFAFIHLILLAMFFYKSVENIYYTIFEIERTSLDTTILIALLFGIILNWSFNIRKLTNYK